MYRVVILAQRTVTVTEYLCGVPQSPQTNTETIYVTLVHGRSFLLLLSAFNKNPTI